MFILSALGDHEGGEPDAPGGWLDGEDGGADGSWNPVFAPAEDFDRLLKELQTTVRGLGYDDVYVVDLKKARDQNKARKASAERFPGMEKE